MAQARRRHLADRLASWIRDADDDRSLPYAVARNKPARTSEQGLERRTHVVGIFPSDAATVRLVER